MSWLILRLLQLSSTAISPCNSSSFRKASIALVLFMSLSFLAVLTDGQVGQPKPGDGSPAQRLEVIGHQGALADAAGALELLERELARLLPTIHELADGGARLAEHPTIEGPGPAPRT